VTFFLTPVSLGNSDDNDGNGNDVDGESGECEQ
jgi:hypothetical protein